MKRRECLRSGALALGLLTLQKQSFGGDGCVPQTPEQTEGPFYPDNPFRIDDDSDLTVLRGGDGIRAEGQLVRLSGRVLDVDCQPIVGAWVEIWQACATGAYDHPDDPNPAVRDPNFQYWGRTLTNFAGAYSFQTIKPGSYPASETWERPPHIHFKVRLNGKELLTTQMYFAGDTLLESDLILARLTEEQRRSVIVPFKEVHLPFLDPHERVLIGGFDIRVGVNPALD